MEQPNGELTGESNGRTVALQHPISARVAAVAVNLSQRFSELIKIPLSVDGCDEAPGDEETLRLLWVEGRGNKKRDRNWQLIQARERKYPKLGDVFYLFICWKRHFLGKENLWRKKGSSSSLKTRVYFATTSTCCASCFLLVVVVQVAEGRQEPGIKGVSSDLGLKLTLKSLAMEFKLTATSVPLSPAT